MDSVVSACAAWIVTSGVLARAYVRVSVSRERNVTVCDNVDDHRMARHTQITGIRMRVRSCICLHSPLSLRPYLVTRARLCIAQLADALVCVCTIVTQDITSQSPVWSSPPTVTV